MAKIEYLESTGTQYINTGIYPQATDTLNIDFKLPVLNSGAIMGFRYKTRNNLVELWCSASNKFKAATGDVDLTNIADADTEMHHFSINPKSGTATLDGNSTYVGNYTVNKPRIPYLFCTGIGNVASNFSKVRIYRFYIEGKIDLVPVRVGSVGYMYDKISGNLFGNSGTGKFVLGPDVEILSYANEIAFLESTGSQYIDTGYVPNSNTVIEASVMALEVNSTPFGVRWTGTPTYDTLGLAFASSSPNMVVYWGKFQNNEVTRVDKPLQKKVGVKIGLTQIDIDGNQYPITRGSISNTYSLYLFGMNNSGEAIGNFRSRIYNLKIIENNTTLFDFIPVEYNNIGYMYDKVSGEFFANQGTGKFVLGHRAPRFDGKACARSYTRRQLMMEMGRPYDAEIEYLQSNAASGFNIVTNNEFPVQCTFELKYKIDNILGIYDYQTFFSRVTTPFRTPSVYMAGRSSGYYYQTPDTSGRSKNLLRLTIRNTDLHTLVVNFENRTITLDGEQSAFADSFTQYTVPSKMCLFSAVTSDRFGLYGKIYYFKITKNNQVLLDLIPVRKGNVGMMYDKVTGAVYKNTSTGTFIVGPDI